jgi:maltooligosyltrehalose trehalohydrolase
MDEYSPGFGERAVVGAPRRSAVGAELHGDRALFRVWAPKREKVEVAFDAGSGARTLELVPEGNGYFSGTGPAQAGERYRLRLDGAAAGFPDPASRFQPSGPHGPSELIDASAFAWSDARWLGPARNGAVLYEMHIGTFTPEGTWAAAERHLADLRHLGITIVEVMPVAEFPGRFGWGYDGVDLFAPSHLYGAPDDFRRFVDAAHRLGLGVVLDVVYNHFGPDGNYLTEFSDDYFSKRYAGEWGQPLNFDGEGSDGVRTFIAANAAYWIEEFHLDGLRLDATQQIFDASPVHIVADVARVAREPAARNGRAIYIVAENEPQDARLVRSVADGGFGLDAMWNDDFHHSAHVAATGQSRAYFSGYRGLPQELIAAAKHGFLYQGQRYKWQGKRRGTPSGDLDPERLVIFIENHDQIANTGRGTRLDRLTTPGRFRALTALLLLMPGTPMLFQGQEFAASSPFTYFADHASDLAERVRQGRIDFVSQFDNLASAADALPVPNAVENFRACVLDHEERLRAPHREFYALHRSLLRLRAEDPVFANRARMGMDGAVLADEAFVLRFSSDGGDRLLLVNLWCDARLDSPAEPLLAPPLSAEWILAWSSEDFRYGGCGTPPIESDDGWFLPGHAAVILAARGRQD